jgi:transposase-like protein
MMKRNRTHPAIVRYGIYLYFSSRSFRLAARCLSSSSSSSSVIRRSHVCIWKWVQKYSDLADSFGTDDRHVVKEIFVDETLLQIDGQNYWLWIAYEPNLNVCLMMHIYQEKGQFSYATDSSSNYVIDMAENQYSPMVRIGTMMHADG